MNRSNSARLVAATAVLLAVTFSASLSAQNRSYSDASAAEYAARSLPEAPEPRTQTQTQTQPSTPQTPPADPAATSSSSQSTTPPAAPDAPAASAPLTGKERRDEGERELQKEEKQRLLGVMPQFQVVEGGTAVPLTAGQKWRLALHSATDPFYIGWAFVIGGGYGELSNSDTQRGYGWGPAGYFKRSASNYADNVNGALIGNALLPALLHQDPRYFRKGEGSIKSRFAYAALSTIICHGDNGKHQFNTSNVLGNFISGAISNAYYPADQRGLSLTLENGLDVTLFGALGGQLLEFGPDLSRLIAKKRHVPVPAPVPQPVAVP